MPDTGLPRARTSAIVTLPNIISFARLCAVPFTIWLVLHRRFVPATTLFIAAGISDALDGYLARRRGGTTLGAVLDPAADKALMVGMFITLAAIGQLPDWLAMLVVFRDLVIVGGIILLWLTSHPIAIEPLMISKLNTTLQITLIATILALNALALPAIPLRQTMITLVTFSTLLSGAAYVIRTARRG